MNEPCAALLTPHPNLDIARSVFCPPRWREVPQRGGVVRFVAQGWEPLDSMPRWSIEMDEDDAQLVVHKRSGERYKRLRALSTKTPAQVRFALASMRDRALRQMKVPDGAPAVILERVLGVDLLGLQRSVGYQWTSPLDHRTFTVLRDDARDGRSGRTLQDHDDQAWYVVLGSLQGEEPRFLTEIECGLIGTGRARGLTRAQVSTLITLYQCRGDHRLDPTGGKKV